MTQKEIFKILKSIGLPITYYQWQEGDANNPIPSLPYLVYYYPSSEAESADNKGFTKIDRLNLELYTKTKDFKVEEKVEKVLNDNDLYFTRQETYLNDEHMFEVLYEMEIVING